MPEWLATAFAFVAGIALFLFGMETMAGGLRVVAGKQMKRFLARSTANPVLGVLTGTLATTALDSSSLVGILTVGLVDAELLTVAQGISVVLGANIGTTVSSQLIAFDIGKLAAIPLVIGVIVTLGFGERSPKTKAWGHVLMGIGALLFALDHLGNVAEPFRDDPGLRGWMERLRTPIMGVLAGAAVTAIIQSSSATVGIVVILASRGAVPLESAVAIMLGAEIGTCLDVLVSTIGRRGTAVRLGLFQLAFNLVTVLVALPLLGGLVSVASSFGEGTGRHVANAHMIFNTAGVLLALPMIPLFARWLERVASSPPAIDPMSEQKSSASPVEKGS